MFNWRINSWAMTVVAVGATACHHASSKSSIITADRLGLYRFSEHVSAGGNAGETIDIEGMAEVLRDSVVVDARPGPCSPDTPSINASPFLYRCGDVTLAFDRRDPILHSRYSVTLSRTDTRRVCARYAVDATGRSTCAEYRTETFPTRVNRTGVLHLTRAPGRKA